MKDVSMFFSDDRMRPIMSDVFYTGNYAASTNGWICIRWENKTFKTPKAIDVESVYPTFENPVSIQFNISDYMEFKKDLPLIREKIECTECEGNGEVEWEYMHWTKDDECPKCKGKGHWEGNNMVTNTKINYDLIVVVLSQKCLDVLCKFLEQFHDIKSIDFIVERDKPFKVFAKIEEYEILMMPIVNHDR